MLFPSYMEATIQTIQWVVAFHILFTEKFNCEFNFIKSIHKQFHRGLNKDLLDYL